MQKPAKSPRSTSDHRRAVGRCVLKQDSVSECVPLTAADKLPFLDLGYVVSPEVGRPHALGVEADPRPLPQPVGQPGQVAIAVQVVGVKATVWKKTRQDFQIRKNKQKSNQFSQPLPSASNYVDSLIKIVSKVSIFHIFH